jgi:tetratricopeptide (TPR) repeat protein
MDREDVLGLLDLAEDLEPELWGPKLTSALAQLQLEYDALRKALQWCVDNHEADLALRLASALWRFWELRGHLAEGLGWLDDALALSAGNHSEVRVRALEAAGNLARSLGKYERATVFYAGSLQARLKLGDKRGIALALTNLGIVAQLGGNDDASVAHHDASFELFREIGDPAGVALSLITLGTMAQLQGRTSSARTLYGESLSLFRALDDHRGMAASLNNLANTLSEAGDLPAARDNYSEALRYFRELGDAAEEAACLKNLASVELNASNLDQAAHLCRESLDLFDDIADGRGVAACLDVLVGIAQARERFELAGEVMGAAEGLWSLLLAVGGEAPAFMGSERAGRAAGLSQILGAEQLAEFRAHGRMMSLGEVIGKAFDALDTTGASDTQGGLYG